MDKNTILKIAKLSKLNLSDDEIISFEKEFNNILTYMDQLKEVNVNGIEPYTTPVTNKLRKDNIDKNNILDKDIILNLSQNHDNNFIIVPTVSIKH